MHIVRKYRQYAPDDLDAHTYTHTHFMVTIKQKSTKNKDKGTQTKHQRKPTNHKGKDWDKKTVIGELLGKKK